MRLCHPCTIVTTMLASWQQKVLWPPPHTFCIAVYADPYAHLDTKCSDLLISGVQAGAGAVFCLGTEASKIADQTTLGLSYLETIRKVELGTNKDFVIIAIEDKNFQEAIEFVCNGWMNYMSSCLKYGTLLVLRTEEGYHI